MFDSKKIDDFFTVEGFSVPQKQNKLSRRAKFMRITKLALPSFAALLIGLLIIIPQLKKNMTDIAASAISPQKGELEKFHMENGVFYITDYKNMVNNFKADLLDETEPGSKIIKMTNPRGRVPTTQTEDVTIIAPIGFYDQNTKLLTLQQGVSLKYSAGVTTDTEELFFDFNQGKAYGVKPIVTQSETAKITAQGFEYYKDKNLLVYTGKSHVTIQENSKEGEL